MWVGYEFSVGHKLLFEATPMIGGVLATLLVDSCGVRQQRRAVSVLAANRFLFFLSQQVVEKQKLDLLDQPLTFFRRIVARHRDPRERRIKCGSRESPETPRA